MNEQLKKLKEIGFYFTDRNNMVNVDFKSNNDRYNENYKIYERELMSEFEDFIELYQIYNLPKILNLITKEIKSYPEQNKKEINSLQKISKYTVKEFYKDCDNVIYLSSGVSHYYIDITENNDEAEDESENDYNIYFATQYKEPIMYDLYKDSLVNCTFDSGFDYNESFDENDKLSEVIDYFDIEENIKKIEKENRLTPLEIYN